MRLLLLCGFAAAVLLTSFAPARKAPAGTVAVPGLTNIFLDKVEITNISWREYLYSLKQKHGADSEEYLEALPDTGIWKQAYEAPFFRPGIYDEYPMVGVTYNQAQAYCTWRSEVVSSKENRKITYSLPSLKVYKMASAKTDLNKIAEGLYSTNLGFRTFLGLCDNAAEMTVVEGQAIRGSEREQCAEIFEYYVPMRKLGFRCMAELK